MLKRRSKRKKPIQIQFLTAHSTKNKSVISVIIKEFDIIILGHCFTTAWLCLYISWFTVRKHNLIAITYYENNSWIILTFKAGVHK